MVKGNIPDFDRGNNSLFPHENNNVKKTNSMRVIAIICVVISSATISLFKPFSGQELAIGQSISSAASEQNTNESKNDNANENISVSENNKTVTHSKERAVTDNTKGIEKTEVAAKPKVGYDTLTIYSGVSLAPLVMQRLPIRDTIYTTADEYLDVNLANQTVTVVKRDGTKTRFLISSGNPYIRDGMATPQGIFTVQNKTPMAISKQFKNARLHWWIGVQGGIGFHGLDGSGYYWNLGKRPSSHGCIRMSRSEIKEMYALVNQGSVIKVHSGDPARVVAFCSKSDTLNATLIDSASVYNRKLGSERFNMLMNGEYWSNPVDRIVHLAPQRLRWGMPIGKAKDIPAQKLPEGVQALRPIKSKTPSIAWLDNLFVNTTHIQSRMPKSAKTNNKDDDDSIPDVVQP